MFRFAKLHFTTFHTLNCNVIQTKQSTGEALNLVCINDEFELEFLELWLEQARLELITSMYIINIFLIYIRTLYNVSNFFYNSLINTTT